MNGLASFEKDHGERFGLKVSRTQLDEGRGIAETMQVHNAKYHKVYKTYCSNSRLNSFTDKSDSADPKLKKKNQSYSICSTEVSLLHMIRWIGQKEST